jgi:two-component system response regulator HydG
VGRGGIRRPPLEAALLPTGSNPAPAAESFGLRERVEAYERGLIVETLKACRNNRSEAARRLDLSRATLHDKLKKYRLGGSEAGED